MKRLNYTDARKKILDGDLLLFCRGDGLIPGLISIAGRSEVYHAGMAVWKVFPGLPSGLYCAHTVAGKGGQIDRLSMLVEQYPGRIKVRKPLPELLDRYDRQEARREILKIIDKPYGRAAIWRVSWIHLPVVRVLLFRYLLPFMVNDKGNGGLPFCSMAVSRACRKGNLDPVPNLGDSWTEPGDLDRSAVFEDFCKLIP